jgi:hypothetical protein
MSTHSHGLKRVQHTGGIFQDARALRSYKHSTTGRRDRRKRRLSLARRLPAHYRALLFKLLSRRRRKLYRAQRQAVRYRVLLFKLRSRHRRKR